MKVTLTHDYAVAPEGHTTLQLKAGDEVDGMIAEMAIRDGKAKPAKELPKPKYSKPTAAKYKG
jgi:hypothetical protein